MTPQSCGGFFRRNGGITVVVKATLELVVDGAMRLVEPVPLALTDQYQGGSPARSLRSAAEIAPFKACADVTLVGKAHAPFVRLRLLRAGEMLLDKTLTIEGELPVELSQENAPRGADNPHGRPEPRVSGSFAPLSPFSATRRALERAADDDFHQHAPIDQRLPPLHGMEQLIFDGLHPMRESFQSSLPHLRAEVLVDERVVALALDSLHLDLDAGLVTVLWRGRSKEGSSVTGGVVAGAGHLVRHPLGELFPTQGRDLGGETVVLESLSSGPQTVTVDGGAPSSEACPFPIAAPGRTTVTVGPLDAPFGPAAVATVPRPDGEGTLDLSQPKSAPSPAGPTSPFPERRGEAIPIFNRTGMQLVALPWQHRPPRDSLTVIVKGSFALVPGGRAQLLPDSDPLSGDVEGEEGLLYASDFAHFKPKVDVVLSGYAHGGDRGMREIGLRLGKSIDARIVVFGERHWERRGLALRPSRPAPFERMPLSVSRSVEGVELHTKLPNLEDPSHPITSPSDCPPSVCWAPRLAVATDGTYDRAWLKTRWPYYPDDFDWARCQSAPPELQIPRVEGNEAFVLSGVHPRHEQLCGSLPAVSPRLFMARTSEDGDVVFERCLLRLDTVVFQPDDDKLQLIWRGVVEVSGPHAPEIAFLHLLVDRPGERTTAKAARQRLAVELGLLEPEDPTLDHVVANGPSPSDEIKPFSVPEGPSLDEAALSEALRNAGADEADIVAVLAAANGVEEASLPPSESSLRAKVVAMLARGEPLDGLDLSGADLHDLDLSHRSLKGTLLAEADLCRANLSGADLRDADLTSARAEGAVFDEAQLDELEAFALAAEGASFRGSVGEGVRLARGRLRGARFDGAELPGLDVSEAELDEAVFDGALLSRARLHDSRARGASWRRARLDDGLLDGIDATGADLTELSAPASVWERASLGGAILRRAGLDGASMPGAHLDGADASACSLVGAELRLVSARGATLVRSNLERAQLEDANLERADFTGACLYGAELWRADTTGAVFDEALVGQTKLEGR